MMSEKSTCTQQSRSLRTKRPCRSATGTSEGRGRARERAGRERGRAEEAGVRAEARGAACRPCARADAGGKQPGLRRALALSRVQRAGRRPTRGRRSAHGRAGPPRSPRRPRPTSAPAHARSAAARTFEERQRLDHGRALLRRGLAERRLWLCAARAALQPRRARRRLSARLRSGAKAEGEARGVSGTHAAGGGRAHGGSRGASARRVGRHARRSGRARRAAERQRAARAEARAGAARLSSDAYRHTAPWALVAICVLQAEPGWAGRGRMRAVSPVRAALAAAGERGARGGRTRARGAGRALTSFFLKLDSIAVPARAAQTAIRARGGRASGFAWRCAREDARTEAGSRVPAGAARAEVVRTAEQAAARASGPHLHPLASPPAGASTSRAGASGRWLTTPSMAVYDPLYLTDSRAALCAWSARRARGPLRASRGTVLNS